MEVKEWYTRNFESALSGRYITLNHIYPLLEFYKNDYDISVVGQSENGRDISLVKIGTGKKVVLAWSQMHGNESTTTKALFDFLKFINQKHFFQTEIETFLKSYTLYIIPILNPDGAQSYTRVNANNVDLNRDAQNLSQKESKCLNRLFNELKPDLCLNMHDQRSIFGLKTGKPATVSFLSPAADESRSLTRARKLAMEKIVKMNNHLQNIIPGQVGRYDDSFNTACVGDTFQKAGVATILFEAGHYRLDYNRETTREFIFYALLSLFDIIDNVTEPLSSEDYFKIGENQKNYNDIILRNVKIETEEKSIDIAIQYKEVFKGDKIHFEPIIDAYGDLENRKGHREKNLKNKNVLTKTQQNLTIGAHFSELFDKSDELMLFFQ
ncbi:M14 family zinc carboxypeptidase [Aequorivita sediminis]|uniref:M14 family zinc carboxypeptidase n=1 Tax=Aequorivita sediminis TaxID=3073653 RepID=UPI0028AEF575|nr:M14 family zinc carboxypeptidase [Aequorivita sp. F6058]